MTSIHKRKFQDLTLCEMLEISRHFKKSRTYGDVFDKFPNLAVDKYNLESKKEAVAAAHLLTRKNITYDINQVIKAIGADRVLFEMNAGELFTKTMAIPGSSEPAYNILKKIAQLIQEVETL